MRHCIKHFIVKEKGGKSQTSSGAFDSIHPTVELAFFAFALILPMLLVHPVLTGISFSVSASWAIMLNGRKAWRFIFKFMLPLMLAVALFNPLFNHRGVTTLFYLGDNPVTLEAVFYGMASALMFGSVLLWFSCFNAVMTSDKIIYLFGGAAPSFALVITMVLRFVPLFRERIKHIALNEKCAGNDIANGKFTEKAKNGLSIISAMTTWALENSITTADSMRARGFGLRGRTLFSPYFFGKRDIITGAALILGMAATAVFAGLKLISIRFFPSFKMNPFDLKALVFYLIYALTLSIPIILNLGEAYVWRSLKSKI